MLSNFEESAPLPTVLCVMPEPINSASSFDMISSLGARVGRRNVTTFRKKTARSGWMIVTDIFLSKSMNMSSGSPLGGTSFFVGQKYMASIVSFADSAMASSVSLADLVKSNFPSLHCKKPITNEHDYSIWKYQMVDWPHQRYWPCLQGNSRLCRLRLRWSQKGIAFACQSRQCQKSSGGSPPWISFLILPHLQGQGYLLTKTIDSLSQKGGKLDNSCRQTSQWVLLSIRDQRENLLLIIQKLIFHFIPSQVRMSPGSDVQAQVVEVDHICLHPNRSKPKTFNPHRFKEISIPKEHLKCSATYHSSSTSSLVKVVNKKRASVLMFRETAKSKRTVVGIGHVQHVVEELVKSIGHLLPLNLPTDFVHHVEFNHVREEVAAWHLRNQRHSQMREDNRVQCGFDTCHRHLQAGKHKRQAAQNCQHPNW